MFWSRGNREYLRASKFMIVLQAKDSCLSMKVDRGSRPGTTCGYTQCRVLRSLQHLYVRLSQVRLPYGAGKLTDESWSGQQMRRPHCFWCTLMLSSAERVFSSCILMTLLRYCVLLPSSLALFVVTFWIWILMVKMILMECFHFLKAGNSGAST